MLSGMGRQKGRSQAAPTLVDFWAPAWQRALEAARTTSGADVEAEIARVKDPVGRARRAAELAAPGNMRVALALALGTTPAEIEKDKAGYRMIAEDAHRLLAMVGLRAGEAVEVEMSDRMQDFLTRFFGQGGARRSTAHGKGDQNG